MKKAILFDLDGTLLPVKDDDLAKKYVELLVQKFSHKYDAKTFFHTLYTSIGKMVQNDGKESNEAVFWNYFSSVFGPVSKQDLEAFALFYEQEYLQLKEVCKENPYVREIIEAAKSSYEKVILATNPFFPRRAIVHRLEFAGLKEEDFTWITSYETSHFCKPNPSYYQEILSRFDLKPEEVLMVGNHKIEDGEASSSLGIECILVGDYLLPKDDLSTRFPHYEMKDLAKVIQKKAKE